VYKETSDAKRAAESDENGFAELKAKAATLAEQVAEERLALTEAMAVARA